MQTVKTVTLDPKHANHVIKIASKFVSGDTLRPSLTGLFFEFDYINTTITACDANRLYSAPVANYDDPGAPFTVILDPGSLKKALQRHKFELSATFDGDTLQAVTVNGAPVLTIDARYPDYRCVIPRDNSIRYTFECEALIRAARAGAVVCGGEKNPKINHTWQVIFDFTNTPKNNGVKFSACSIDHSIEISGSLGATWPGSDKIPDAAPAPLFSKISFNGHLLADTLQALQCDSITLLMEKSNRGVILETGDDRETVLIMPLLIGE